MILFGLIWFPARGELKFVSMAGKAGVLRAAAAGLMSVDVHGGDLIAATRAGLLADAETLQTAHLTKLAATVGTTEYADNILIGLSRLGPGGAPIVTRTTLAQALFDSVTAMRAMAYLPRANITDADPSVYFLSRNFMNISDACEAAIFETGASVSASSNFYASPVFIFVAVYAAAALGACVVVYVLSRRALRQRLVPLERLAKLPNSVLSRLESGAAAAAAAAERSIEFGQAAPGEGGSGVDSQDEGEGVEDATDWRSVSLATTSKDMQKGSRTVERRRERLFVAAVLAAPLVASSVVFIVLANVISSGLAAASVGSNALTGATLTQIAARQAIYYTINAASLPDELAGAAVANTFLTYVTGATRLDAMFFGPGGDGASDSALQDVHFGDLCALLPLAPTEAARCGGLAGGVCHSGVQSALREIIHGTAALLIARGQLSLPAAPPSRAQVEGVRALLDSAAMSDMRVMDAVEVAGGMAVDGSVRAARVEAAASGALSTMTALVAAIIVGAAGYQVSGAASLLYARGGDAQSVFTVFISNQLKNQAHLLAPLSRDG